MATRSPTWSRGGALHLDDEGRVRLEGNLAALVQVVQESRSESLGCGLRSNDGCVLDDAGESAGKVHELASDVDAVHDHELVADQIGCASHRGRGGRSGIRDVWSHREKRSSRQRRFWLQTLSDPSATLHDEGGAPQS